MVLKDIIKLTLKDVKSGGLRSILVLLSVAVGAASLIAFVAQAEGMRYNVESQFRGLSANIIIGISPYPTLSYQDMLILRSFDHVVDVKGAIVADVKIAIKGEYEVIQLVGVDTPTFFTLFPSVSTKSGKVELNVPGLGCIGYNAFKKINVNENGVLPIKFGDKTLYVRISGILEPLGVSPLAVGFKPDDAIFINIEDAKIFLNTRKMNLVYVIVDSPKNVNNVFEKVNGFLRGKGFQVFAPLGIIKVYMSAVNFAERFLLAMSLMASIASGFSIANTMMITVIE